MKKRSKLLAAALVLALVVCAAGGAATLAEDGIPGVVYDGGAKRFLFENAVPFGRGETVDLFPGLKGLMPGDTCTQELRIRAKNLSGGGVSLRLFAENANDDCRKLLGKTDEPVPHPAVLTVLEGGSVLSETALTAPGGFYLGSFSAAGTKTLTVTLHIPPEAGNELSGLTAALDWVFKATELPAPSDPGAPDITIPDEPVPAGGAVLDRSSHFGYIIGRGDGGVQPESHITRAEVATIFFRLLTDESRAALWTQTNPYTDVPADAWYNSAVSTLTHCGVLEGYGDDSFRPNGYITRAEFAAMASRFYAAAGVYSADAFTDIGNSWAREYINRAAELGLVSGYGDGTFRPALPILRAEAMQLINNVLGRRPVTERLLPDMHRWADNADETKWYYAAVQEATNSHDYDLPSPGLPGAPYEIWTVLLPVRDWAALEAGWAGDPAAAP